MPDIRGLPLLSGPPPQMEGAEGCRKCSKEFNMFLNRSRKCNHCGYSYCQNCTDYQAMMPRRQEGQTGYDPMNVCAYCIEFLTITAAGRGQLRSLSLGKLKKYVDAYNIRIDRAVEKDDLIDGIIGTRTQNGCLPSANENYYRKYSVPDRSSLNGRRGFFSRTGQGSSGPVPPPPPPPRPDQRPQFARPDLADDAPEGLHSHYPPPPASSRPQGPSPYQRPGASHSSQNVNQTNANRTPPRARASSAVPPPTAPPPTLDELVDMPDESIASLSIGSLKAILFTNHVNAGLILEKGELVTKVRGLVEDERHERDRQRALEEAEEADRIERQRVLLEQHRMAQQEREERARAEKSRSDSEDDMDADEKHSASPASPPTPPKARATAADLERPGLCVICQDDEANIAIVDCGHLAMCRGCSDLVMASSRECPLCRTRIVTEARLLRIFKT
ncbi:hypothetical protein BDZ94DRAFT_1376408 [Collybia nuda]|uniref:RING-type domain-containing protein n=1 Tax=Collybia nuda TaxID=64659 RepID=A0A9P5YFS3_9AGAR|nr:hypothetical protein BDZ94DRAFT_1376408 [Collybia nuda]